MAANHFSQHARRIAFWTVLLVGAGACSRGLGQGSLDDYRRAESLRVWTANKVTASPKLHWLQPDLAWYVDWQNDRRTVMIWSPEFLTPAFSHRQFAEALSKATGKPFDAQQLDVQWIAPVQSAEASESTAAAKTESKTESHRFTHMDVHVDGRTWRVDLNNYQLEESQTPKPKELSTSTPRTRGQPRNSLRSNRSSPDGRWTIELKDHNVHCRHRGANETRAWTTDGTEKDAYIDRVYWSPDSQYVIVMRRRPGQEHLVHMVESSPKDQLQPQLITHQYLKPGDDIPQERPQLFAAATGKSIPLDDSLYDNPWSITQPHWSPSSRRFHFLYNQRGHQRLRLLSMQADTGETGVLIDEHSKTFVDYAYKEMTYYLDQSDEVLWMSERDGWNHLYLIDARTGTLKNQVTRGRWVVRHVDRVDEERRRIWFWAGGVYPGQDPYYLHYCRVDFDGSNLTLLTDGNGTHQVEWSPERRFLLARYSRVDRPPVTELRDGETGELIRELHRADAAELLGTGWRAPERLVFKGRDDKTDIYGILWRPTNFDPQKKYPVIESIYAGPHAAFCPKHFRDYYKEQALAELGFIVVKMDGMGTSHRSKAFHDVCSKNLGDSGFPDRIKWIREAAQKYPWMDVDRVGIYGGSAGGQSSTRALLAHGDFYDVAVSDCGCHDNRMDKIWWNELWMGWPIGPHYAEQSNVTQAHRLQGKLLLIVGEVDRNVDPASTLQVVDALIKADKDFDMLLVPGAGHGIAESHYGTRRRRDFFVRHLLEVEPRWTPSPPTPSPKE